MATAAVAAMVSPAPASRFFARLAPELATPTRAATCDRPTIAALN